MLSPNFPLECHRISRWSQYTRHQRDSVPHRRRDSRRPPRFDRAALPWPERHSASQSPGI